MKRLLQVEMRRFWGRRMFRALTVTVLILVTFGATIAYIHSDDSPAAIAEARAQHRAAVARCVGQIASGRQADGPVPAEATSDPQAWCRESVWFQDPRFDFRHVDWMIHGLGIPFMILGWLIGASFIGAEWTNRTIVTTLTWETRRIRVWLTKAISVGVCSWCWILLLQAAFAAAMLPAAYFEGTTANLDVSWWSGLAADAARIAAVGAGASIVGLAIATIGRNTAGAFGAGFAYLAVVETVVRRFKPSWASWLLGDNIGMVIAGPGEVRLGIHSSPPVL